MEEGFSTLARLEGMGGREERGAEGGLLMATGTEHPLLENFFFFF